MTLDIGDLPYRKSLQILRFCIENDIDAANVQRLLNELTTMKNAGEIQWAIDVPESFATYMELRWG